MLLTKVPFHLEIKEKRAFLESTLWTGCLRSMLTWNFSWLAPFALIRGQFSGTDMTGRPGYRTMEMIGGSSASYLARTPCVPLFSSLVNRGGKGRAFRLPGAGGDHFHCAVEPSPGHIRCRSSWTLRRAWLRGHLVGHSLEHSRFRETSGTLPGTLRPGTL